MRIYIQDNFKKSICFDIQNTSIVNFLSSFFLGILVALNFLNNEILVLFYGGFLYFLYKIFNQGDWIKFIIFFNLIIILNLFTMYFGSWISRKIT